MINDLDNIIDIGCGQGLLLENLKSIKKNYFGIDLSVEQIKVCEAKKSKCKSNRIKRSKRKI